MKKTIFTIFFTLFITGQSFAQQSITTLNLLNPTYPSSFVFTDDGYWNQTYNEVDYTFFKSQVFSFSHLIEGVGSSYGEMVWNGFTVCNSGDSADYSNTGSWMPYQWGCMAGGGIKTDAQGNVLKDENGDVLVQKGLPYLVTYWNYIIEPEWWHLGWGNTFIDEPTRCLQILLDDNDAYEAVGVYVNTHPYSYYAILHGFGLAHQFNQEGDFFKLIIHGMNKDGTESGKQVEHFLAKYENSQLTQSTKWEWVDLTSLGEVGGFYCTLETTDANAYGPLTPVMFCMDKLQVRKKGTEIIENKDFNKTLIYSHQNCVYFKNVVPQSAVEVYDFTGRMVYQGVIHDVETVVPLQVPTGIYHVVLQGRNAINRVCANVLIRSN